MKTTMFGRLGDAAMVEKQEGIAKSAGGVVTRDKDAGTVEAIMPPSAIMFRALDKGDGVWLIMYSTYFYSKGDR